MRRGSAVVLRSAKAGSGGNVLIEGAAGIGKTSLLAAAAELAEAERMTVLRARGGVLEREFALGVVDPAAGAGHRPAHRPRA